MIYSTKQYIKFKPLPLVAKYLETKKDRWKLKTQRRAYWTINQFYHWMNERNLRFDELTRAHIESYIACPHKRRATPSSYYTNRQGLRKYFEWLQKEGLINKHLRGGLFPDTATCQRNLVKLPDYAKRFHQALDVNLKKGTRKNYRHTMSDFHSFLENRNLRIDRIRRPHVELWLKELKDRGLKASTRSLMITSFRAYLSWLYDEKLVRVEPDKLILKCDRPQQPLILPRPFSPKEDLAIQEKLSASNDIYHQGLLLMRLTGLRIGELAGLEYDCVRTDHDRNKFLKVPLGKLNNERLVPLDDRALGLIERIRKQSAKHLRKLYGTKVKPDLLIVDPNGRSTEYHLFHMAFLETCKNLQISGPTQTHRLRHTYATSLINGGMSLTGIMKLLGHRNIRMTMRYTDVTQETVRREYFTALKTVNERYATLKTIEPSELHPAELLMNTVRWLKKHIEPKTVSDKRNMSLLTKRLERIRSEIDALTKTK